MWLTEIRGPSQLTFLPPQILEYHLQVPTVEIQYSQEVQATQAGTLLLVVRVALRALDRTLRAGLVQLFLLYEAVDTSSSSGVPGQFPHGKPGTSGPRYPPQGKPIYTLPIADTPQNPLLHNVPQDPTGSRGNPQYPPTVRESFPPNGPTAMKLRIRTKPLDRCRWHL
ncbi:hypothetical protein BSL78_10525 [Apostichopus japonicus]|uniref:Uncharacterized protein n=1 Tax=Stichopus japonicus TaxID=307972 RepID=A0A2G8KX43_STIJA|nr:hypothetical protein BSL78_10525 [Apostichopus japonicus]